MGVRAKPHSGSEGFDGAAVDSLVFEQLLVARPALRGAVRVIHRSPELGVSPVVASTLRMPEALDLIW